MRTRFSKQPAAPDRIDLRDEQCLAPVAQKTPFGGWLFRDIADHARFARGLVPAAELRGQLLRGRTKLDGFVGYYGIIRSRHD